jgi:hypothetical protein
MSNRQECVETVRDNKLCDSASIEREEKATGKLVGSSEVARVLLL